jgi:valine dehydrogenase (NAD+)
MDVVARRCEFVTGRSADHGGAGDSGVLTAFGVFQGMRAAAKHRWGSPELTGLRVGVAGVGKVGRRLVGHLVADGADVIVSDVDPEAVRRLREAHPEIDAAPDTAGLLTAGIDVFAPCALGGVLTEDVARRLTAAIVCGGANNQLASDGVAKLLHDRGVLYAPDYVVNAGGVIQVADEIHGFDMDRARAKAAGIFDTTLRIFEQADRDGVPPSEAADRLAEQRMQIG